MLTQTRFYTQIRLLFLSELALSVVVLTVLGSFTASAEDSKREEHSDTVQPGAVSPVHVSSQAKEHPATTQVDAVRSSHPTSQPTVHTATIQNNFTSERVMQPRAMIFPPPALAVVVPPVVVPPAVVAVTSPKSSGDPCPICVKCPHVGIWQIRNGMSFCEQNLTSDINGRRLEDGSCSCSDLGVKCDVVTEQCDLAKGELQNTGMGHTWGGKDDAKWYDQWQNVREGK